MCEPVFATMRFLGIVVAFLPAVAFAAPSLMARVPSAADQAIYLNAHNAERAKHGAAALTWDANLANAAQKWANGCRFQHSGGAVGAYGENLSAGTGSFGAAAAVKLWTDEGPSYNPSSPQPSHWTQVVWKGTTKVGCAVADCSGIFDPKYGIAHFHVCEYNSPGNVLGQFPQNVQK